MEKLPATRITLNKLCELAELYGAAKDGRERFDIDQRAYDFLAYLGFAGDRMARFIANYRRLKEENTH